ncbi:uncharacterized protein LOC127003340 isoform X2 [Eriocheir sinensis]|uniref:uncharacterized protein LOC127003340 isoform X2 n=1 Tax=Eriocheir sinensis TaxID=95602 RepID=UPI0021C9AD23|nr:uncharacterized protein LOC127003340 isoform X2 [Eriocheir sinensis]
MMKVVGVIGAGAAGLCAAHHISATPGMTPVVWEKAAKVGGTWVYTPQVGKDEHGLPIFSSMYKNLKTNLPKEVMQFPDFPFPEQEESFLHHTDVLGYLEDYAKHYELHQYIKFGCNVEEVKPVEQDEEPTSWSVTVKDLEDSTTTTTVCDAIFVCNGHYSVPKIPSIKDIEKFHGRQTHSHDYREPEPFKGERVVMLGAGPSGLDISLEVAAVAKEVILSHNHPIQIPSELPANVRQTRGIVAAHENGFIFGDGSRAEADVLMYCTGYEYTFPFLSEKCGVTVEDSIVKPLYKHIINVNHPTMAFIGIPSQIVPFPLFDIQVQYFIKTVKQDIALPNKTTMEQSIQAAFADHWNKGQATRHFHKLGKKQWNYNNDLAALAGIPPLPPYNENLYDFVSQHRKKELMYYKNMSFKITGPDTFQHLK